MFQPSPTFLNNLFHFGNFVPFPVKDIPQYDPNFLPHLAGVSLLHCYFYSSNNSISTNAKFTSQFNTYLCSKTHLEVLTLFSGFILLDNDNEPGDFRLNIVRGCLLKDIRLSSATFSGFFENEIFRYNSNSRAIFSLRQTAGFDNLLLAPAISEFFNVGICLCRFMPNHSEQLITSPSLEDKIGLAAFGLYLPRCFRANTGVRKIHFLLYSPKSPFIPTFSPLFTIQSDQMPELYFFNSRFLQLHFDLYSHTLRFNGQRIFGRGDSVRNLTRLRFLLNVRSPLFDRFPEFSRISVLHHCSRILTCSAAGKLQSAIRRYREYRAFRVPHLVDFYQSCSSELRQYHLSSMFFVIESRILPSKKVALCASVKPMLMIRPGRSKLSQWVHFCSTKYFTGTESSFEIFCTQPDCNSSLRIHGNSVILTFLCLHLDDFRDGRPINAQFTPPTSFHLPELLPMRSSIDLLFRHLQITTHFSATTSIQRPIFTTENLKTYDNISMYHFKILDFASSRGLSFALLYSRFEDLVKSLNLNETPQVIFILPRHFDNYIELDLFIRSQPANGPGAMRLDLDTPETAVLPNPGLFFTDHVCNRLIISRFFPAAPEGVMVFHDWYHYSLSDFIGRAPLSNLDEHILTPVFFDLLSRQPQYHYFSGLLFRFGFDIFQIRLFVLAACFQCCLNRFDSGLISDGLSLSDIHSAFLLLQKLFTK